MPLVWTARKRRSMANRSKRYVASKALIVGLKQYSVDEAVTLLKQTGQAKVNSAVELHAHLGLDPRQSSQQVRTTVKLAHGTGKKIRLAAIVNEGMVKEALAAGAAEAGAEDLINKIKATEQTPYDIIVAGSEMMSKLVPIAKILGTRGLMPSPKSETVSPNPIKAITELLGGKISFKSDESSNVHLLVGRVGFTDEQLRENIEGAIEAIKKAKPDETKGTYFQSCFVCTAMGPSIRIKI